MMQIFVINIEGKSVKINVESEDRVKTVKEKIEVEKDISFLYQCLVFNGKPLMDDKSLNYYNIQNDSNLHINLQACWKDYEYHEVSIEPSVDWMKLATAAKDRIDQEVEEKKAVYAESLKRKMEAIGGTKNIKASMKSGEMNICMLTEQLLEKEKEVMGQREQILWMELELERRRLVLESTMDEKSDLENGLNDEQVEMDRKRQKLSSLEDEIVQVHGEMQDTLLLGGEDLARENEKHKLALKEFVNQSISKKEALLECPVCYQTASPPIYKCPMEHLLCKGCLPRVDGKCPTCRTELNNELTFRLAEEIWEELDKLKKSVMDIKEGNEKSSEIEL
eukprot:GFUD01041044.1.p1 GENE.GFUD01041044.1~~GFUD01041044.1.p1  ORF type:complete len:336 (+),score=116.25 GFUD01041044.1:66-1073(+)